MKTKICEVNEIKESKIKKTWYTINIDSFGQKTGLITSHEGALLDFYLLKMSGANIYENENDAVLWANY